MSSSTLHHLLLSGFSFSEFHLCDLHSYIIILKKNACGKTIRAQKSWMKNRRFLAAFHMQQNASKQSLFAKKAENVWHSSLASVQWQWFHGWNRASFLVLAIFWMDFDSKIISQWAQSLFWSFHACHRNLGWDKAEMLTNWNSWKKNVSINKRVFECCICFLVL